MKSKQKEFEVNAFKDFLQEKNFLQQKNINVKKLKEILSQFLGITEKEVTTLYNLEDRKETDSVKIGISNSNRNRGVSIIFNDDYSQEILLSLTEAKQLSIHRC